MSDTSHIKCPRCGKDLPVSAPEGLCPACLGALNFATETELSGAELREALPPLTPQELAPHFPQLEILECLGRGGMGVVYKARQRTLNRLVALKLLAPERVQDAKFADRFAREAQALAALNHPNIVTIHDFGKAGGFYYLLMEFVDGLNLRQLLRSRKLQPTEALAIVPPVCEALQYAHEHGIVHRDIKPENLLLAKDGRVKIADFGIAKMLGTDASAASISLSSPKGGEGQGEEAPTASATQQTTMGTPQYMAPEQREQPQNADHRTDIYALGVVLYELLTGELPTDKLQPPSKKVQIDVRLDEVVLRALEKTPELRYQTAGEFKTQLEMVGGKSSEQEHPAQEGITSAKSGPIPRELKVIAGWMMVQGGLALLNSLFAFISWGQIFLNLLVLHLLIGFGLLSLKTGWWRAAVAMNGIQLFASLVGIPLLLFAGAMAGNMLTPGEAFRGQPVILGAMVLIQCVLVVTCTLVHLTLLRLRREGWFSPVPSKHGTTGFPVAVVIFYAGVILGILLIGVLSFRFNRDSAYLLLVGIMAVASPFVGVMTGNALQEAEQSKDQSGLARIKGWLNALSIVAWVLAVPVVGFAVFFFVSMLSEQGGWNPAIAEAVLVTLTWLGAVLLPWVGMRLWRTASQSGVDSHPRKADSKGVRLWVAGAVLVLCLLAGFALLSANARRVNEAQAVARAAAERDAQRVMKEGMPRTNHAVASQNTSNKISTPDQSVLSTQTEVVPTTFGFPIVAGLFIMGLFVGLIALLVWLTRKKGLKGCLLAGAIMLGVLLGLVGLVLLLSFGYRATKANSFNAPAGTTLDLRPIGLQAPASQPTGLAMQVQNGFNIRASGGQLVTFEFFMRQGDDRLEPLPQLTAKLVTAPGKFFEGSVSWMGKRGDDARNTNQLWFWSVNGYQQGGLPQPNRPDYETNLTYTLRSGEVLNWWQLAMPAQVNLMPGAAPQDIPLFRTFGSATLDPKQPKEAIVRVTCEALLADYQFGGEKYQFLLGAKHDPIGAVEHATAALPHRVIPQSVVDEARAEVKRAAALFADGRSTRVDVIAAEYHLQWAEAMFNGDVQGALQAKRDGAAVKLENIDLLVKAGRGSPADRAKAVRELAEAEAALAQLPTAKSSSLGAMNLTATASLTSDYETDLRWRWRVSKLQPARILFSLIDTDATGTSTNVIPLSLRESPPKDNDWNRPKDLVLTLVKQGNVSSLRLEDQFITPEPLRPNTVTSVVSLQSWQGILSQTQPVRLSSDYYQTLWEAEIIRHSADDSFKSPRRLRMVARLASPDKSEAIDVLQANDPVKEIRGISNNTKGKSEKR